MYKQFELPIFTASIFYFDDQYTTEIPNRLKEVLASNGYFPPTFILADRLTRGRYLRYKDKMQSYLKDAYTGENILHIGLTDANSLKDNSFWKMDWKLTFHKFGIKNINTTFKPWNVLTFTITYDRLKDKENYHRFFKCVTECIELLQPFYANMDDADVSVTMSEVLGANSVLPTEYGKVKAIHWGNYFGKEYCQKYGVTHDKLLPVASCEAIGEGILFTLTDSAIDCTSSDCLKMRKRLARELGVKPPNILFR